MRTEGTHHSFGSTVPVTIDLATLVTTGWHLTSQAGDLRYLSILLFVAAFAVLVRTVLVEIQSKGRQVLILGSGPMAAKLIQDIESSVEPRYVVAGVVDDEPPGEGWPASARWLGPARQFAEIVERVQPSAILVAVADRRHHLPLQSLLESRVRGVVVEEAIEFSERLTGKIAIESLRPSTLILSKGFRNYGAAEITARIVSVVAAAVGLVFLAPLLLLVAAVIKLDSRGPVLFVQERAGRNGRPFGLLKFRTMRPCDEPPSEWVLDNADRITRVGRWLRRFRIDELPQLVNILRGHMNLIGPRPHPTVNHQIFRERIAYYGLRSSVRPGITGWAQVRYGYANNLEEETEKMRYDLYYIKNRSLVLDIRILLETFVIMLFGQGASEVRRSSPRDRRILSPRARRRPKKAAYMPALEKAGRRAVNS